MSVETAVQVIEWSKAAGATEITLLGGEPSLAHDFVPILNACRSAGLHARVVTNGCDRIQALLQADEVNPSNVRRVAVSLDSLDSKVQDRLRGPRALADAMATIELLRERSMTFDINVTATTSALDGIWELVSTAAELGCRRVNIHWPSAMGLGRDLATEEQPDEATWRRLVDAVEAYTPPSDTLFVEVERVFLDRDQILRGCALIEATNLQVMPDGRAYRCGLLVDDAEMASLRFDQGQLVVFNRNAGEERLRDVAHYCVSCPVAPSRAGKRACIYDKARSLSST